MDRQIEFEGYTRRPCLRSRSTPPRYTAWKLLHKAKTRDEAEERRNAVVRADPEWEIEIKEVEVRSRLSDRELIVWALVRRGQGNRNSRVAAGAKLELTAERIRQIDQKVQRKLAKANSEGLTEEAAILESCLIHGYWSIEELIDVANNIQPPAQPTAEEIKAREESFQDYLTKQIELAVGEERRYLN